MGEMRDSDWSRQNLLRSDWLGPGVATMTTHIMTVFLFNQCLSSYSTVFY